MLCCIHNVSNTKVIITKFKKRKKGLGWCRSTTYVVGHHSHMKIIWHICGIFLPYYTYSECVCIFLSQDTLSFNSNAHMLYLLCTYLCLRCQQFAAFLFSVRRFFSSRSTAWDYSYFMFVIRKKLYLHVCNK